MRIAAVDAGTNSFHLLVVDAHRDGTFVPLLREKDMLRLGDEVGRDGRVSDATSERAVETIRRFRAMADSLGVDEFVACGTSALREAENGSALADRIHAETGVKIRVISGREEARLIFGAIRTSVVIDPAPALCFDLGGGSLEVMVGDGGGLLWSGSVKLGVARMTSELVESDPPSAPDLRRLRDRLSAGLAPIAEAVADLEPAMAIGSSGTLCSLAGMVAARAGGSVPLSVNQLSFKRDDFLAVHDELLSSTSAERARMPGGDSRRADLLPAGAVFLATAMDLFGFEDLTVSEWALREGIVLDAIGHHDPVDWSEDRGDIRRASVLNLCRRSNWDEAHGRQVSRLAVELFDHALPLHRLGPDDRELLEYAGLVHDIGQHVAIESHHKHTSYLVQHGSLRGFAPGEVDALAALARYHRRSNPKPGHEPYNALDSAIQERVTKLSALLRIADGLDRGHTGVVDSVDVEIDRDRARLTVHAAADCELELWGARRKRDLFERLFGVTLDVVAAGR
ncbi:MAG: exopolyphosphatase [Acidimicrobiales bacterium]|nr:exopolyphosphatase [Acidimicrobiales bacterium]